MRDEEMARMFRHETSHFWFVGTRAVIRDEVQRALTATADQAEVEGERPWLLDVGCGTGAFLSSLDLPVQRVGLDYSAPGLRFHRTRGDWPLVRGSAMQLPFADGSLGLVTALDVLEHLPDDRAAAADIARVLAPGGACVATLPAHQALWSPHDEALGHQRRYSRRDVLDLFAAQGLVAERLSAYNAWLLPPIALIRWARRLLPKGPGPARSDVTPLPAWLNRALGALLASERHVLRHARLPLGVSWIGTFRK